MVSVVHKALKMDKSRVLALLVVFTVAIFSLTLAAGCGGVEMAPADQPPAVGSGSSTPPGSLMLNQVCAQDVDCADGMLCTKTPYDRKTAPVCTYKCDATNMNPKCTMGCN